jgi:hypothetical protein
MLGTDDDDSMHASDETLCPRFRTTKGFGEPQEEDGSIAS